ncbi:hypothetical protein BK816_03480 [Boudabousia tangfeifanii]|uniref:Uncharacterized protein n=1 Tax=Boudabousia tangfeifanii TaxID=1912795 RepID=A0A1D9MJW9_9ACTO|nr:Rv3235 family protein [Boudabousia tangfeifanii]AOZ72470.1 hypothetical protein BK816_03480 [Boudabousia tangfeifanii]
MPTLTIRKPTDFSNGVTRPTKPQNNQSAQVKRTCKAPKVKEICSLWFAGPQSEVKAPNPQYLDAEGLPLPNPAQWTRTATRAVFEMLMGYRILSTQNRWTDLQTQRKLKELQAQWQQKHPSKKISLIKVGGSHAAMAGPFSVESSAWVKINGTIHTLAIRLEAKKGRWIMTSVDILNV